MMKIYKSNSYEINHTILVYVKHTSIPSTLKNLVATLIKVTSFFYSCI